MGSQSNTKAETSFVTSGLYSTAQSTGIVDTIAMDVVGLKVMINCYSYPSSGSINTTVSWIDANGIKFPVITAPGLATATPGTTNANQQIINIHPGFTANSTTLNDALPKKFQIDVLPSGVTALGPIGFTASYCLLG